MNILIFLEYFFFSLFETVAIIFIFSKLINFFKNRKFKKLHNKEVRSNVNT